MTDLYKDPPNWLTITDEIRGVKTLTDVKNIVDRIFPGLIVCTYPFFSKDYPLLSRNWMTVCKQLKLQPTCILILRNWEPDDDHKLVAHIAECFTKAGFLVRTDIDVQACTKCGSAIPTELYHSAMLEKNIPLPTWSPKCSTC